MGPGEVGGELQVRNSDYDLIDLCRLRGGERGGWSGLGGRPESGLWTIPLLNPRPRSMPKINMNKAEKDILLATR